MNSYKLTIVSRVFSISVCKTLFQKQWKKKTQCKNIQLKFNNINSYAYWTIIFPFKCMFHQFKATRTTLTSNHYAPKFHKSNHPHYANLPGSLSRSPCSKPNTYHSRVIIIALSFRWQTANWLKFHKSLKPPNRPTHQTPGKEKESTFYLGWGGLWSDGRDQLDFEILSLFRSMWNRIRNCKRRKCNSFKIIKI